MYQGYVEVPVSGITSHHFFNFQLTSAEVAQIYTPIVHKMYINWTDIQVIHMYM